jgi:hypothetical protein
VCRSKLAKPFMAILHISRQPKGNRYVSKGG